MDRDPGKVTPVMNIDPNASLDASLSGPPEPHFPPVIDNTMRSDWRLCPELWYNRHCLGLVPSPLGLNIHLHFGACFAAGTEAVRRAYCAGEDSETALFRGVDAVYKSWGDVTLVRPPAQPASGYKKSPEACIDCVRRYFSHWPLDTDPMRVWIDSNGKPAVEWAGAEPIDLHNLFHPTLRNTNPDAPAAWKGRIPLVYAGRFDFVGTSEGRLWGVDDKTATSLGDYWRKQWSLRGQFTGYCWLAAQQGIKITGFQVRGVSPTLVRGERGASFDEVLTMRPQHLIDRWYTQLRADVTAMLAYYELRSAEGPTAGNYLLDNHCGNCNYYDLCAAREPTKWYSNYAKSYWDPLARGDASGA